MKEIYSLEDDLEYLNNKVKHYSKIVNSFIKPFNKVVFQHNRNLMYFEEERERVANAIRDKADYEEHISCKS